MGEKAQVLVLGAYGLAGRAIVARLAAKTGFHVVAAGRNPQKLDGLLASVRSERVRVRELDASDPRSLRDACTTASFVINAVGPYPRSGAAIARVVVECGRPYLDCANEQRHYHNLAELDALVRGQAVPMITAAGAIPGLSTLLIAHLLERFPEATGVDCCWAQFRHAYADAGLASMMGGLLEAADRPVALREGKHAPLVVGRSTRHFDLPEPFGRQRLLEVPTIDTLTIPAHFPLQEFHTWFYMGDLPTGLLGIVRILQPNRRPWAYRLIETIMRRINARDTRKAMAAGVGPESLLVAFIDNGKETTTHQMLFRDGAAATACLPVHIASRCLRNEIAKTGLLSPLDVVMPQELPSLVEDAALRLDIDAIPR